MSALDSDVSQHVLFNGIKKSTLNQIKTVIMTTSFASDLSFADTVPTNLNNLINKNYNFFKNIMHRINCQA